MQFRRWPACPLPPPHLVLTASWRCAWQISFATIAWWIVGQVRNPASLCVLWLRLCLAELTARPKGVCLRSRSPARVCAWRQVWVFTSDTCSATNHWLFVYSIVLIILVYISICFPLLVFLALCVCLPCVLLFLRLVAEPEGAPTQVVESLPKRTFDRDGDRVAPGAAAPSCAICMTDYQFGEELRVLPCKHEFHASCVDQWLLLKKTCPYCRCDITNPGAPPEPAAGEEQV